jgi:hypothetical protein
MKRYYAILDKKTKEIVYGGSEEGDHFLSVFETFQGARICKVKHPIFYQDCVVKEIKIKEVK